MSGSRKRSRGANYQGLTRSSAPIVEGRQKFIVKQPMKRQPPSPPKPVKKKKAKASSSDADKKSLLHRHHSSGKFTGRRKNSTLPPPRRKQLFHILRDRIQQHGLLLQVLRKKNVTEINCHKLAPERPQLLHFPCSNDLLSSLSDLNEGSNQLFSKTTNVCNSMEVKHLTNLALKTVQETKAVLLTHGISDVLHQSWDASGPCVFSSTTDANGAAGTLSKCWSGDRKLCCTASLHRHFLPVITVALVGTKLWCLVKPSTIVDAAVVAFNIEWDPEWYGTTQSPASSPTQGKYGSTYIAALFSMLSTLDVQPDVFVREIKAPENNVMESFTIPAGYWHFVVTTSRDYLGLSQYYVTSQNFIHLEQILVDLNMGERCTDWLFQCHSAPSNTDVDQQTMATAGSTGSTIIKNVLGAWYNSQLLSSGADSNDTQLCHSTSYDAYKHYTTFVSNAAFKEVLQPTISKPRKGSHEWNNWTCGKKLIDKYFPEDK